MNIEQQFQSFAKGYDKKVAKNNNVFIYTRVSSKDQEQNKSLVTQLDQARAYALAKSYNVMSEFGGTYESASGDFTRKEFKKLIDEVRRAKNKPYGILLNTINRFSRSGGSGVALATELVEILGVHIMDVSTGNTTETEQGKLLIYQELLKARQENIDRLKHTLPGMVRHIKEGKWLGNAPKGYDHFGPKVKNMKFYSAEQTIKLNEEGHLLKKAWQWKLQGERDYIILKKLEELGLKISKQTLSDIWRNPFYCGISTHRMLDGNVVKGQWEKMVSERDFLLVQKILEGNNFGYKQEKSNPNRPLNAFVTCIGCGNKLTGYANEKKGLHYYKCQCCKGGSINANTTKKSLGKGANDLFAEFLEQYSLSEQNVKAFEVQLKMTYDLLSGESKDDNELFQKQLDKLEAELKTIKLNKMKGEIDDEELYLEYKSELETKIFEIKKKMEGNPEKLSNLNKYVSESVTISQNINKYWVNSGVDMKKRIQELIFPNGLVLDMKNRHYLTKNVNVVFEINRVVTGGKGDKIENGSEISSEPSSVVAGTGLEPVTFGL
jgi:DNA invertase Pin-like site-specific DNA recombinase